MDTKAAFEKWCSEKGYSTEQFHYGNWAGQYKLESVRNKWEGWKASRAAIEIELPGGTGWASDPYNHGRNAGINQCAESVKFHGIRIKGKTS